MSFFRREPGLIKSQFAQFQVDHFSQLGIYISYFFRDNIINVLNAVWIYCFLCFTLAFKWFGFMKIFEIVIKSDFVVLFKCPLRNHVHFVSVVITFVSWNVYAVNFTSISRFKFSYTMLFFLVSIIAMFFRFYYTILLFIPCFILFSLDG